MLAIKVIFDGKTFVPQEPVSLPVDLQTSIYLDEPTPPAVETINDEVRRYYQELTDSEDQEWGRAVERDLPKAWDED